MDKDDINDVDDGMGGGDKGAGNREEKEKEREREGQYKDQQKENGNREEKEKENKEEIEIELVLLGHSIGGWIARAYLSEHCSKGTRKMVKALVTLGSPHIPPPAGKLEEFSLA